jgi:hypothetical protein
MLLDPAAANAFIAGYKRVLLRIADDDDDRQGGRTVLEALAHARDRVKKNPVLLEQALVELETSAPTLDGEVVRAIRTLRVDDWVYLRDSKTYAIFIQRSGEFALGVLALTQRLRDIVGGTGAVIEAGVVRYCGQFVCDGLVSRVVSLGPSYRRSFGDTYRVLRATGRFQVGGEA